MKLELSPKDAKLLWNNLCFTGDEQGTLTNLGLVLLSHGIYPEINLGKLDSPHGQRRQLIANWLRSLADDLEAEG